MLIQVKYRNGTFGRIRSENLDELIRRGEIVQFQRSSGWTSIVRGRLRHGKSPYYCIPERRATLAYRQLLDTLEEPVAASGPTR